MFSSLDARLALHAAKAAEASKRPLLAERYYREATVECRLLLLLARGRRR